MEEPDIDTSYLEAQTIEPVQSFKPRNLTRKQKAFVKQLVDNPKRSATEAAATVYDVSTRHTAEVIASENLRKPEIIMALAEHAELFESAIVGTVREWKDSDSPRKREIAMQNAQFGHDKVFGKSTTKIEQQTSIVQIAINLTGDGEQPPAELLDLTNPVNS